MEKSEMSPDVEKLNSIELELINLIADAGDEPMLDKFLEWQAQRKRCNERFMEIIQEKLNAVEREAVGKEASAEEDFYCTEHADYGDEKCKTQCPYCERV